jgi:glucokinase
MVIAVFDIGGSHISLSSFDVASSRLIGEDGLARSVPTNETDALTVLLDLVRSARALHGSLLKGLSMAVPNPFDHARGISLMQHKLVSLYGLNLKRILSELSGLPEDDIVFVNDADAFLLGSLSVVNISGCRTVGITLGTGVGSAFADGTKILLEGHGVPDGGEIWDLSYDRGTVEDTISTRRLEDDYLRRTGDKRSVKAIAHAARGGDIAALEVFESFGVELARVLQTICLPFSPEKILLGGGISSAADLFLPAVCSNPWCAERVLLVPQRDIAPMMGAAVWWSSLRTTVGSNGSC